MKREEAIDLIATTFDATGWAAEDVIDTLAMRANIAWDPEEPEVLWQASGLRLLSTGKWEREEQCGSGQWAPYNHEYTWHRRELDELARRLLEEHKQQEALDEHNNKLEAEEREVEPFHAVVRQVNRHTSRLGKMEDRLDAIDATVHPDIDRRLTVLEEKIDQLGQEVVGNINCLDRRIDLLEARPALGKAGDLPGDPAQVAMHYSEWKKLVAVYELWGPEGTLRERLSSVSWQDLGRMSTSDLAQLRSELLALPVEEFPL